MCRLTLEVVRNGVRTRLLHRAFGVGIDRPALFIALNETCHWGRLCLVCQLDKPRALGTDLVVRVVLRLGNLFKAQVVAVGRIARHVRFGVECKVGGAAVLGE